MRQLRHLWLAAVLATAATAACAHKPSDSYLTLTVPASGSVLEGQWDIALRDLDFVLGLDADRDGAITWGELKAARGRIADYAFTRLTLEGIGRGDRNTCPTLFTGLLVDEHVDGHYAVLRFRADCGLPPTCSSTRSPVSCVGQVLRSPRPIPSSIRRVKA